MPDLIPEFADFDEHTYLGTNPDVAAVVASGEYSSGLEHYFSHGYAEGRAGVAPPVKARIETLMAQDGKIPVPPEYLMARAHGSADPDAFESVGRRIAYNLYDILQHEYTSDRPLRVLDFGCGCARVLRYFHILIGGGELHGKDIDREAIDWCTEHLGGIADFSVNDETPPLIFATGYFDVVYSISVMTHLPETLQLSWLGELARVLKPEGLALVSTHGEELLRTRSKRQWKRLRSEGFLYMSGGEVEGLPTYYKNAYHTHEYIRSMWSQYFEVERILSRGIAGHQDLVVCRKNRD
jgi:SAM-dependent methyltransferase